jgi:hypothetical protein
MAEADAEALQRLFDSIDTENEAVAKLFELTADKAGLLTKGDPPPSPYDSDEDEDEDGDQDLQVEQGDDGEVLHGVRMVQLFLNETNIAEFHEACMTLAQRYSAENLTDTVLEAMRRAVNSL